MSSSVGIVGFPSGGVTWKLEGFYPDKNTRLFYQTLPVTDQVELGYWPPNPIDVYISVVVYDSQNYVIYQAYKLGPFPMENYQAYNWDCGLNTLRGAAYHSGQILMMSLMYDGQSAICPVSDVPLDSTAKMILSYKNSSTVSARFGANWTIKRPNGSVAQTLSTQGGYVVPGMTDFFVGQEFNLNAIGNWRYDAELYVWTGAEWLLVDTKTGILCTVESGAPIEPPVLIAPPNGAVVEGTTIDFSWNAVPNADDYLLAINFESGGTFFSYLVGNVTHKSVSGFPNSGVGFKWKVYPKNDYGVGPVSEEWLFTNGPGVYHEFSNFTATYSKLG